MNLPIAYAWKDAKPATIRRYAAVLFSTSSVLTELEFASYVSEETRGSNFVGRLAGRGKKFVRGGREAKPPAVSFELAVPRFALMTFVNQLTVQRVAALACDQHAATEPAQAGLERNQPKGECLGFMLRVRGIATRNCV